MEDMEKFTSMADDGKMRRGCGEADPRPFNILGIRLVGESFPLFSRGWRWPFNCADQKASAFFVQIGRSKTSVICKDSERLAV